jgi:hypothetical protein
MLKFYTIFVKTFVITFCYTSSSRWGYGTETVMGPVPLRQKVTVPNVPVSQHWMKLEFNDSNLIVIKFS